MSTPYSIAIDKFFNRIEKDRDFLTILHYPIKNQLKYQKKEHKIILTKL